VALFWPYPEGPALFFRPAALSVAHIESLYFTPSALPDEKQPRAALINLVLTGPSTLVLLVRHSRPHQSGFLDVLADSQS
jgi:hypothetical protein